MEKLAVEGNEIATKTDAMADEVAERLSQLEKFLLTSSVLLFPRYDSALIALGLLTRADAVPSSPSRGRNR